MLKSANGNSSHGSGHHYNFNDQNVTDLPPLKEAERMTGTVHEILNIGDEILEYFMNQLKAMSMREQKISHKASIMSKSAKKVKKKKNKNKKKGEIKFSQNAN